MAHSFSFIGICNAALSAQGQDEIVSENDGTPELRMLSHNWPSIVESELEDGAYFFTKEEATLLSRQDGQYGYEDSYLVPADTLHVRQVWALDSAGDRVVGEVEWVQDGTAVHLNNEYGIIVEYVTDADESLWSANFSRGVQLKLEALIARSMKEETQDAMRLEAQAEVHFQRARTLSSKSRSAKPMTQPGRIALARFSRA